MASTTDFEWKPEYDAVLGKIASTDDVEGSDWNELCQIIKAKLEQNVNIFLATLKEPPRAPPFNPIPSTEGGHRLPPFPPTKLAQLHLYDPLVSYMSEDQAKEAKEAIFEQLEQFEDAPPFTIQRLCELLLEPTRHYKSVGKYLRAVEKSILVTSSHGAFPIPPESTQSPTSVFPIPLSQPTAINGNGLQTTMPGSSAIPSSPIAFATRSSITPSTPLFSPIPFLHADARSRSKSRSPPPQTPPMTPLTLGGDGTPLNPASELRLDDDEKVIGLVDELDDPSPGHLSDKPTPLTAAATASQEGGRRPSTSGKLKERSSDTQEGAQREPTVGSSTSLIDNLGNRFVKEIFENRFVKSGTVGGGEIKGGVTRTKVEGDETGNMKEQVPARKKAKANDAGGSDAKVALSAEGSGDQDGSKADEVKDSIDSEKMEVDVP